MPAKSRSQQRLFAMVHAYNKGEFHGSRSLRSRVAALSRRISDEDARHFAETPHAGLPERKEEKKAQVVVRPETVQAVYAQVPVKEYAGSIAHSERSEQRRSFLGHVVYGTGAGAVMGGLTAGGLGAFIAHNAAKGSKRSKSSLRQGVLEAALRCGMWGAGRGAVAGSVIGAGRGVVDKVVGSIGR